MDLGIILLYNGISSFFCFNYLIKGYDSSFSRKVE